VGALDVGDALLVHAAFEMAGIGVGMRLLAGGLRRAESASLWRGPGFTLVLGCLLGAIVGSKLAVWLEYPHLVRQHWTSPLLIFTGQSIVGGLIGRLIKKPVPGAAFHPAGFIMSILGAIALVYLWRYIPH